MAMRFTGRLLAVVMLTVVLTPLSPAHSQVYVQDSPAAAELLRAAEDRVTKDEIEEAARLVQQVLDEHGDKLLERKEGGYGEARRLAADLLMSDVKLLKLYRQLMEPLGARMLTQAGADRTRLIQVVDRYGLTDAGLQAGLKLAGLELEAGEASAAGIRLTRLSGHPGLSAQRPLWHRLVATAALVAGDSQQLAQAKAALKEQGGPAALREIEQLEKSLNRPAASTPLDTLDVLPESQPPSASANKPLWSVNVGGAERFLVDVYKADETSMNESAERGQFLNTLPYLSAGVLYINDGQTVYAIEPSAGKELWRQQVMEVSENFRRFRPYSLPYGVDINTLAATPQRVVAVMGFGAMVTIYPYYRTDAESQLTCLDAATGAPQWLLNPEDISPDLKESFFYGKPVISQGRVFVTVRRRQRTQFQDAYLVALELATGQMVWKRHLASAAMSDRQTAPALSHLLLQDGWIYVDSRLGTVAKVSAADGEVDWMAMAPVEDDVRPHTAAKPWHVSAPVLTAAGLVVYDDWSGVIRVFNPADGVVTTTIPAEQWGNPELIAGFHGDVLAIGTKTGRYHGKTLSARWTQESEHPTKGRAALTRNILYIPADDKITMLDAETGAPSGSLKIALPASILVRDGQLIAAGRTGISSYSSWEVASRQLEQRIKAAPDDPRPLLALAWLAYKSKNEATLLSTLDKAIELAAKREKKDDALSSELFAQLLSMAGDAEAAPEPLRRQLFDRLAAVTSGPDQEVTYHLSLARFLESTKRFADAVEHYQHILAEPNYRRRLFTHDNGSRQAGLEAQRLLQVLLEKNGAQFYAPYEAFAAKRLEELSAEADPAPLIELSEAYPLASITPKALQVAAERTAQQNRIREAVGLLRRAAQLTKNPQLVGEIYGRQAELFESAGQPHRARRVLRTLTALYPDIKPTRSGVVIDAQQWLAALASQPQATGLTARLSLPLAHKGQTFEGTLLSPTAQDPEASPSTDLLLRLRDRIELRRAADLSVVWSKPMEAEEVQLLSIDRSRIWLYFPMSQRMQLLDAADGKLRWEETAVRQKIANVRAEESKELAVGDAAREGAAVVENRGGQLIIQGGQVIIRGNVQIRGEFQVNGRVIQLDGNQLRNVNEVLVGVCDTGVALADHEGRVLMLNADGGKVRWQAGTALRRANRILVDSQYVILSGTDEEESPLIVIYDAQSGVLLHRLMNPKRQNILWMGLTDEGSLVYVSTTQVEAFDLNRGRSMWISKPGVQLMGADATWVGPERLLIRTQDYDLLWINMADGQITQRLPVRASLPGQVTSIFDTDQWLIVGSNHMFAADLNGKFLWRDAIVDAGPILDMAVSEKHVALLTAGQEGGGDARARKLYLIDRATGAVAASHALDSAGMLDQLLILDGKLLVSGPGVTAIIEGGK